MADRAVDADFDTQNRAYYAARDMQTLGEPATGQAAVRARAASSDGVPRRVGVVILTAAVVIGGLYLLWQARQIIGWCVGGCVIAVALDPAVNRMQQYQLKRSTAILLVYGALVLVGLGLAALFLPPLVDQIQGVTAYGLDLASHPERGDPLLTDLASRYGLTAYLPRLNAWLHSLSGQLTTIAGEFFSYSAALINSVAAMISMLFIAFYLLLDGQRMISALFQFVPEAQRPRARRILGQSAGAVSGYILGNVTISVICGVAVFVVLVLLRMPYAGALALMVGVLDLIPQVGATLGGVALVLAGLFINLFNSLVLLFYFIVYQQVENYLLQPLVYSRRVQLHPLTIFIAVVLGGVWLGVAGAFLAIPAAEIIRIVVAEWLASRAEQNHAVPGSSRHGSDVKIDQ
jgi:predicted PurR-regulated permease PerM